MFKGLLTLLFIVFVLRKGKERKLILFFPFLQQVYKRLIQL